jgi:5-formyltetrahydrofolate cyclo-ligase
MPHDLTPAADTADSSTFRAALRREKLAARMALEHTTHAELSARLEANLELFLLKISAMQPENTLAFCAPTRNEFDAGPLISRLIQRNLQHGAQPTPQCIWRAAMPIVIALDTPMIFRAWTPTTPMSCDRYGIPIPHSGRTTGAQHCAATPGRF